MARRQYISLRVKNYAEPLHIIYTYTKGSASTQHDKHGDPGDAGAAAEVEFLQISAYAGGPDITELLRSSVLSDLEDQVIDRHQDSSLMEYEK